MCVISIIEGRRTLGWRYVYSYIEKTCQRCPSYLLIVMPALKFQNDLSRSLLSPNNEIDQKVYETVTQILPLLYRYAEKDQCMTHRISKLSRVQRRSLVFICDYLDLFDPSICFDCSHLTVNRCHYLARHVPVTDCLPVGRRSQVNPRSITTQACRRN